MDDYEFNAEDDAAELERSRAALEACVDAIVRSNGNPAYFLQWTQTHLAEIMPRDAPELPSAAVPAAS